jgi:hypothetical protein
VASSAAALPQAPVVERQIALPPAFGEERAVLHEELYSEFSDQKLLIAMCASVNDARYIVRRTLELIEQSRILLREFDDRWPLTDRS